MREDLVARARGGDQEAFASLVTAHTDRCFALAYRILRDSDRADDATQQALVAAWDHLPSLRDPDRFDAWSYTLVVRAAYREARRERVLRAAVRWVGLGDIVPNETPERLADRDELEQAFERLSPEHRAILTLRYYADLPGREIAEVLGIPVGTVGSRLHHATRRLREELQHERQRPVAIGQVLP